MNIRINIDGVHICTHAIVLSKKSVTLISEMTVRFRILGHLWGLGGSKNLMQCNITYIPGCSNTVTRISPYCLQFVEVCKKVDDGP